MGDRVGEYAQSASTGVWCLSVYINGLIPTIHNIPFLVIPCCYYMRDGVACIQDSSSNGLLSPVRVCWVSAS